jgi:uncharacterized protein YjiS (DUF1127 family)
MIPTADDTMGPTSARLVGSAKAIAGPAGATTTIAAGCSVSRTARSGNISTPRASSAYPGRLPGRESSPSVETLSRAGAGKGADNTHGGVALAVVELVLAFVRVWRQRRRNRCQLAAMNERELQDIGICRSEIANEIGKPFWRAFEAARAIG